MKASLKIDIPEGFCKYLDAAVVRLTYLFPDFDFSATNGVIVVKASSDEQLREVKREIMHQLYRERIYSETLSVRRWLSGG